MTLLPDTATSRDQAAWKELRSMLQRFIARRVPAPDRDDVLQEVFVRIQRGLPELREGERLTAWVYQVARNTIIDHFRRSAARRDQPGEAEPEQLADPSVDDQTAADELAAVVTEFVQRLPPPYREALELTDLQGVTQAEAARRVGLSVPGMKSRVQRARAQLRDLLDACCDIELDARGRVIDCEPRDIPTELAGCCKPKG